MGLEKVIVEKVKSLVMHSHEEYLILCAVLQVKAMHYPFPHTRIKLQRDPKDHTVSGTGLISLQ